MKLNIILRVLAVISLIIFLAYSITKIPTVTHGFTAYYTLSRMLLEGEDIGKSYDDAYFNAKINEYGIKDIYDVQHNLPSTAFAYAPVAWLDPQSAKKAWGILSIVLVLIITALILKIYSVKLSQDEGLIIAIIIFLWHPLYENISLGQIYVLLLFLFLLAMLSIKKKSTALVSLTIAADIILKGYGLIIYLWMLITKHYKVFVISLLILLIVIFISLPIIKIDAWRTYFDLARTSLGRSAYDSNVAYQSVNGFIRHLFVYDNVLNPHAILNLSEATIFLFSIIINLSIIIFILFRTPGRSDNIYSNLLAFSAIIAVSVVTSPVAEEHPYVLFLPLAAGMIRLLFIQYSMTVKVLFVLSLLLLLLPLHYKTLGQSPFPVYLLAYPKLYGGILMLFVYSAAGRKIAEADVSELPNNQ